MIFVASISGRPVRFFPPMLGNQALSEDKSGKSFLMRSK